ncbi:hypothetical protein C2E23DRAFT_398755 [Lenzites betulinus]|nr:hypothetical protein C2E23DRAFT_398755 [Lenzites betulinus]
MVNRKISRDLKERAAALVLSGSNVPSVAHILGVSVDSVKRWTILSRFTADQLVFADESSKNKCTLQRNYGRGPAGKRAVEVLSFARGVCYSILPAKDPSPDSPRSLMRSETTKVGRLLLCEAVSKNSSLSRRGVDRDIDGPTFSSP